MNRCHAKGYLVGSRYELPSDETDYWWTDRAPVVGCSQLRCQRCGARVRSAIGWRELRGAAEHIAEVYDEADWSRARWVERGDADERLYVCRCGYVRARRPESVERSIELDPDFPWRCEGHPIVTLPFTLRGVQLDVDTDLIELLRRSWQHVPSATSPRLFDCDELRTRIAGTVLESRLDEAARELLTDDTSAVRMAALGYFFGHPQARGVERVLALAQGDRVGFAGIADPIPVRPDGVPTLERRLLKTVAHLAREGVLGPEAILILRRDVQRPEMTATLLPVLLAIDPDWAREQLIRFVETNPSRAPELTVIAAKVIGVNGTALRDLLARIKAVPGVDVGPSGRGAKPSLGCKPTRSSRS